jgi:hypothetical protein
MNKKDPFWPTLESVARNGITAVDMLAIVFFLEPAACADPSCVVQAFEGKVFCFKGLYRNSLTTTGDPA